MTINKILTLGVVLAITQGCAKKTESNIDSVDATEAAIESGISVISGSLDDQQSSSGFSYRSEKVKNVWASILIAKANALGCSRAIAQACENGIKEIDYGNCTTLSERRSMDGTVTLTFSDSGCSMATDGNTVIRTYNTQITGPRGGLIVNSSDSKEDYRLGSENTYGGGAKLTKTLAGHNLEILGKHKRMEKNGRELFNVSVRTLQPLEITGGFSRDNRRVSNGQLEINHNLAKFTSVITSSNLHWTDSCCHPISGTLNITKSGSVTGSSTVTFSDECGVASLEENGQVSKIELSYCE